MYADPAIALFFTVLLVCQEEANSASDAAKPSEADGEVAAAAGEGADAGDLDFGEMKKKKKKSKKAAFDMDAFEKELGDGGDGAADGKAETGAAADGGLDGDEGDLGDDPFAANDDDADEAGAKGGDVETWHGTDRDYSYQEVSWWCSWRQQTLELSLILTILCSVLPTAPRSLLWRSPSPEPSHVRRQEEVHNRPTSSRS